MTDATFHPVPRESLTWTYFKACMAGFAMGLTASSLLAGASFIDALLSMLFEHVASAIVMLTMAPALSMPIRFLAGLAARLNIPRGISDIAIGALAGSVMMLPELMRGALPGAMGWGFLMGGAFGGFVFWRGRGYPDAALLADITDAVIGRFRRAP